MKKLITVGLIALLTISTPAFADEVTDQISEALKAYNKKDFKTAATALSAATTLIQQKRGDELLSYLPKAPSGWKEGEKSNTAVSSPLMDGGLNARKEYRKGKMKVKIGLISDSPMLQPITMMFANPQMTGGKVRLMVIDGERFMYNKRKNSYMAIIANTVLLSVEGNKKTGDDIVRSFLKQVNIAGIESFAKN